MRQHSFLLLLLLTTTPVLAQVWTPLGPRGGDVRVVAVDPADPARIFLGTADGHIFSSEDTGGHWILLGRASSRTDAVITAIVVDPRDGNLLYASSWARDSATGGGAFRSADGGRTWIAAGLAGQAVRALVMAPSDSSILVAGTLDGVYRSLDASKTWERISPEQHAELRNIDSLAVDPRFPQTIFVGTFHLPWKTSDGGRTWLPIHAGMIDDSDVMSLFIDGGDSRRIYASACSGIYRSDDSAAQWRKIQGIPYTARRTYAITQDPQHPGSIYAATSEGLWKTADSGMTWQRMTPESWVVNTVVVTGGAPERVVIGTEKLGVLASDDGGEHFQDANAGFDHRQILALAADPKRSGRILAVLAHAPATLLETQDDGHSWSPMGSGLHAEEALRVYAAPDDTWWVSLTRGGLMGYDAGKKAWMRAGAVDGDLATRNAPISQAGSTSTHGTRRVAIPRVPGDLHKSAAGKASTGWHAMRYVVADVAFSSNKWFAATNAGLLISTDRGATWKPKPIGQLTKLPLQSVRVSRNGEHIRIASVRGLIFSDDGGNSWTWHDLPLNSGGAVTLNVPTVDERLIVVIARNGLYISHDAGTTWQHAASGLPSTPVRDFVATGSVFVASMSTGGLYFSTDSGGNWDRVPGALADGFFAALAASDEPGVLYAASPIEGVFRVDWASTHATHPDVAPDNLSK